MIKRILSVSFIVMLLLAACGTSPATQPPTETNNSLEVTVFRTPT